MREIPIPVCAVVGKVLGEHYYNHAQLNNLFMENGAPGDPPRENCVMKCTIWLKRANNAPDVEPFEILGGVLEEFMEVPPEDWAGDDEKEIYSKRKKRVEETLANHGLSYQQGGIILGSDSGPATKDLDSIIRTRDFPSLRIEYQRAVDSLESDPATAITAASAIFEAFCKIYIEEAGLDLPPKETAKPLWEIVRKHQNLARPVDAMDNELKNILNGLTSVVDGFVALRNRRGSAHGRGKTPWKLEPRHAQLAVNASHALVVFLFHTWDYRRKKQ